VKLDQAKEGMMYQIISIDDTNYAVSRVVHHGLGPGDKIFLAHHVKKRFVCFYIDEKYICIRDKDASSIEVSEVN